MHKRSRQQNRAKYGASVEIKTWKVDNSAKLCSIGNFRNYFSQANCWKAHGIAFGATGQGLEHKLMLISMIWRFQKCYWECWNRSGTLESFPGDG